MFFNIRDDADNRQPSTLAAAFTRQSMRTTAVLHVWEDGPGSKHNVKVKEIACWFVVWNMTFIFLNSWDDGPI